MRYVRLTISQLVLVISGDYNQNALIHSQLSLNYNGILFCRTIHASVKPVIIYVYIFYNQPRTAAC